MKYYISLIIIMTFITFGYAEPSYQWIIQAGGYGNETGNDIAVDNKGNVYVIGYFWDGPVTFGNFEVKSRGKSDIFITKLDKNGKFLWVIQAGGKGLDKGQGITIDPKGNIYITGFFTGEAVFGKETIVSESGRNTFIAKLNSNGKYQWVKMLDLECEHEGKSIALDKDGNILILGHIRLPEMDDRIWQTTYGDHTDKYRKIFVAKIDPKGKLLWTIKGIKPWKLEKTDIISDNLGNIYVFGDFKNIDKSREFDEDYDESIISKIDKNGSVEWSRSMQHERMQPKSIAIIPNESNDHIYSILLSHGQIRIFDSNDITSEYFRLETEKNADADALRKVLIDDSGNLYIIGYTKAVSSRKRSTAKPSSNESIVIFPEEDETLIKFDPEGNEIWSKKLDNKRYNGIRGITLGADNNIYFTGYLIDEVGFDDFLLTSKGHTDIFIAKLQDLTRKKDYTPRITSQRFIDTGDGTVTDKKTGLMWTKNVNLADKTMTWYEAMEYCDNLNYAGYSDWRLPGKEELESLIDKDKSNDSPALPSGHPFLGVRGHSNYWRYYWSSSTRDSKSIFNTGWAVCMSRGSHCHSLSSRFHIWPVRREQSTGEEHTDTPTANLQNLTEKNNIKNRR